MTYTRRKIPITCWYRYNKQEDSYEYNHFELGYFMLDYPLDICPSYHRQKAWKHSKWKKKQGYLVKEGNMNKIIEEEI